MDRNPNWISLMSECILRDLDFDFNRRQITDSIIHAMKNYEDIQRIDHLSNTDHLNKTLPIKEALEPIKRYSENESGLKCIDSSNKPILIIPNESKWIQKDHCKECTSHESESGESSESQIEESENETSEENLRKAGEEKINIKSTGQGVSDITTRRFKRKPTKPLKSPSRFDPSFKGVTFQLRTKWTDQKSHLKITAFYSSKKNKFPRPRHKKCYSLSHSPTIDNLSASDTEIHELPIKEKRHSFYGNTGKQCASCGTKKTPLWRDAEDGTPLCNACGIRYKKYRIRCTHCWHIPKKDSKSYPHCSNCGELLKLALFRKSL